MTRKEWVILGLLIAGVAALEISGRGADWPAKQDQSYAPRSADPTAPPDTVIDPMGAFRTVSLHVTGMT